MLTRHRSLDNVGKPWVVDSKPELYVRRLGWAGEVGTGEEHERVIYDDELGVAHNALVFKGAGSVCVRSRELRLDVVSVSHSRVDVHRHNEPGHRLSTPDRP